MVEENNKKGAMAWIFSALVALGIALLTVKAKEKEGISISSIEESEYIGG